MRITKYAVRRLISTFEHLCASPLGEGEGGSSCRRLCRRVGPTAIVCTAVCLTDFWWHRGRGRWDAANSPGPPPRISPRSTPTTTNRDISSPWSSCGSVPEQRRVFTVQRAVLLGRVLARYIYIYIHFARREAGRCVVRFPDECENKERWMAK